MQAGQNALGRKVMSNRIKVETLSWDPEAIHVDEAGMLFPPLAH